MAERNWFGLGSLNPFGSSEETEAKAEEKGRPFTNEIGHGVVLNPETDRSADTNKREVNEQKIFDLVRKSPEALSLVQAMVDDVIGAGADFTYLGETSGKRATKKADRFYRMKAKEEIADMLFDGFFIGDGYLYKDMRTEDEVKDYLIDKAEGRFNNRDIMLRGVEQLVEELKQEDERIFAPSDVQMVPASTMTHQINEHGDIEMYHQDVGIRDTDIPPEKMVHFDYLRLNGKTYGFSPFRSIVTELSMLANAKDHNSVVFSNAGVVNKVWNLPNDGPDSQNYELLKQTIKKYRNLKNKHKDLILTGEVDVEDLNSIGADMEFRELAEYVTRVVVMAWGVPPTRVGMSIGGDAGARVTSLTHQGYFRRIKRLQNKLETILNLELFEPHFNCHISFRDPDVQTAIKKADKELRETDVAVKRMATGMWSREEAMDYLGVQSFEGMDFSDKEDRALMRMAAQISSGRNKKLSELSVFGDQADEEMAEDTRQAVEEQMDEKG